MGTMCGRVSYLGILAMVTGACWQASSSTAPQPSKPHFATTATDGGRATDAASDSSPQASTQDISTKPTPIHAQQPIGAHLLAESAMWWSAGITRPLAFAPNIETTIAQNLWGTSQDKRDCNALSRTTDTGQIKRLICEFLLRDKDATLTVTIDKVVRFLRSREPTVRNLAVSQLQLLLAARKSEVSLDWIDANPIAAKLLDLDVIGQHYLSHGEFGSAAEVAFRAARASAGFDPRACGRKANLVLAELLSGNKPAAATTLASIISYRSVEPACLHRLQALGCHLGIDQARYGVPLRQEMLTKCGDFILHGVTRQKLDSSKAVRDERTRRVAVMAAAATWPKAKTADDWLRLSVLAMDGLPNPEATKLLVAALNNSVVDGCSDRLAMENAIRLIDGLLTGSYSADLIALQEVKRHASICSAGKR